MLFPREGLPVPLRVEAIQVAARAVAGGEGEAFNIQGNHSMYNEILYCVRKSFTILGILHYVRKSFSNTRESYNTQGPSAEAARPGSCAPARRCRALHIS